MASQDDILTIPDVAGLLRVAEKTVYGLAQKGDLPAFKVGGPMAIPPNGHRLLDRREDTGCWRAAAQ